MIARLKGIIDVLAADHAVIDVNGVGYRVYCSARTLSALGAVGEAALVHVETHVREDHIHLYGFAATAELESFTLLQSVQGVGAKLALQILSAMPVDELIRALGQGDLTALSRAPGVGKKLAQRLATELRDRVGAMPVADPALSGGAPPPSGAGAEALSALINLGYRRMEAEAALARAAQTAGDDATVETLIPAALKELAR